MKNYVVSGYEPKKLFEFFEDICRIPHGSGNEKAIADYLVAFAEARGIECYRDAIDNVFYRIPATVGRENEPSILLQGHTDMVCEKNSDSTHDFLRDPLDLYVDEKGNLRARGTTLGGDDGIAVAAMMAVADGMVESHPAIECLFTVSEETGLDGANGFDYSLIKSRILLNMDSEEEDAVIVGCAGGVRSDLLVSPEYVTGSGSAYEISLRALRGGHSGEDIASGRANANILMVRIFLRLLSVGEFSIASLRGGSKENAIPRECRAVVAFPTDKAEAFVSAARDEIARIAKELSDEDAAFVGEITETEAVSRMISAEDTRRIATLLGCVRNGVLRMSTRVKGFTEWSRSLGVLYTEDEQVHIVFSSRSAIEAQLDASIAELDAWVATVGGTANHYGRYPGWDYNPDSPVREKYLRICREVLGIEATARVIHAGLECGVIASHLPGLDAISFGPNMADIHSPDEALDLASVERFWKKLVAMLA